MDAACKSLELATQVRQNAEEVRNVMNDIFSWEKEIKDKEKQMQAIQPKIVQNENNLDNKEANMPPVRSLNIDKESSVAAGCSPKVLNHLVEETGQTSPPPASSPTEKQDTALDPKELRHKEANEIKDRGNNYVKQGEYEKAINEYTQAMEMYPDDAVYVTNRALCYLKLERYNQCIEDCDQATEIDKMAVKAYYRRMQANESLGNNLDALKDCTTVLMIEPKNIVAQRSLERINERMRKHVNKDEPNFTTLCPNLVDILPIDKPAYKRSTKPLKRIPIADIVGPKNSKNCENFKMSDDDIDKLFNSNCGYFEEIKDPEILKKSNQKLEKKNKSLSETKNHVQQNNLNINKDSNKTNQLHCKPNVMNKASTSQVVKEQNTSETKNKINNLESKEAATPVVNHMNEVKNERPLPAAPIKPAQFYANWKELSASQKFQYLKSIKLSNLWRLLGAGFDSDTLTDVICTLHDYYLPQKNPSLLASTLLEVSKNKQVPILSLLMSNEERKALSELVNYLKENDAVDAPTTNAAEQIATNFKLN